MKRLFSIAWILLIMTVSLFGWLRPMSINVLNYFIWKTSTPTHVETGKIYYQGAKIDYVSYGQGDPVLLLHGGLSNRFSWFSQIPWLVSSGRRVILIDTRGHGYSTKGYSKLSYQVFAEDTLQVLDRLGIQRTDVVGWSDGGIIALLLGLEAPQRISKIVAISANFHPSGVILEEQSPPVSNIGFLNSILDWFRGVWSGAGEQHPSLEAEIIELWRTEPQFEHSDLNAITAPTLVLVGENDIIDLNHSNELARMLANGRIEVITGAGHAAPVTHTQEINQLIASFLGIY